LLNTSYQRVIQTSPFEVVYGRPPPTLLSYEPGSSGLEAVDRSLLERDEFIMEVKDRLQLAQQVMREYYDRTNRDIHYDVGDWVWL